MKYHIGTIPVDEEKRLGKEIVAIFSIDGDENFELHTDSTNDGFINRSKIGETRPLEPIASRFYPVTQQAYLQSASSEVFLVNTNRAVGVASFQPNEIQIMLHRRTLVDDFRGVGEALNDTRPFSGELDLAFGKFSDTEINKFGKSNNMKFETDYDNVELLTLEYYHDFDNDDDDDFLDGDRGDTVLVRIENVSDQGIFIGCLHVLIKEKIGKMLPFDNAEFRNLAGTKLKEKSDENPINFALYPYQIRTILIKLPFKLTYPGYQSINWTSIYCNKT